MCIKFQPKSGNRKCVCASVCVCKHNKSKTQQTRGIQFCIWSLYQNVRPVSKFGTILSTGSAAVRLSALCVFKHNFQAQRARELKFRIWTCIKVVDIPQILDKVSQRQKGL